MQRDRYTPIIVSIVLTVALVSLSASVSAATVPHILCLAHGEAAPFSQCNAEMRDMACLKGACEICVDNDMCPLSLGTCYGKNLRCDFSTIPGAGNPTPQPSRTIISSPSNDAVFSDTSIPLNVRFTQSVDAEYQVVPAGETSDAWDSLCSDCSRAKKTIRVGEGEYTFNVRNLGTSEVHSARFYVDSKEPKISSVSPREGFTNGTFMISFNEKNPIAVSLVLEQEDGEARIPVDLKRDCSAENDNTICSVQIPLRDLEQGSLSYAVEISDIAGNSVLSRTYTVGVDSEAPHILDINSAVRRTSADITLSISDDHFDRVTYVNLDETTPRTRVACTRLQNGECHVTIANAVGDSLVFTVSDAAGNEAQTTLVVGGSHA